jgi:antitoxin (DNA-binding transcriptional repressor) of toxin-antitoxin stability system
MTLTEVNQNVSAALRLADKEDVVIWRHGRPMYKISRITAQDPVDVLIETGRLIAPAEGWRDTTALPVAHVDGRPTSDLLTESRDRF